MIRRACATLAILVLVLQSASGGHMLLVEHTKCAEHGELAHSAHSHSVSLDTDAGPSLSGPSNTEGDASHEHCSLATERKDAATPIGHARIMSLRAIEEVNRIEIALAPSEDTSRFRLAPKTSPPA